MKQTVFIISLLALILTSIFGVFGSQIISELKTEVSSIETYDDTSINTSIASLISEINNLETSDYSELTLQIENLQTAIDEISEFDDTDLLGKTASLEAQVTLLNSLIATLQSKITLLENSSGGSSIEVLYDSNGEYMDTLNLMSNLCMKYFDTDDNLKCMVNLNMGIIGISYSNEIYTFTEDEVIARMMMIFKELSYYPQYLSYIENIEIRFSTPNGEYYNSIITTLPSLYILSGNVTYEDVLPSSRWILNEAESYKFVGEELVCNQIIFSNENIESIINNFISNNTFGENLLTPSN